MAKLHRLCKADDRFNTHVLTFLIPSSIASDTVRDFISGEFMCGYHKWNISLARNDKHIGAFVTLKNPTHGLSVTADYAFSLVNRGHYTANETFTESGVIFSKQNPTHGRKAFVSIADLKSTQRGFSCEKDNFLLEVTLSSFKTTFECPLQLPLTDKDRLKYPQGDVRMETGAFSFAGSEWNVAIKVNDRNPTDVRGGSSVTLRRLSNFDHYCKFRYRIHVGLIEPVPPPAPSVGAKPATLPPPKTPIPSQNKVISSNEMESLFIDADTQDKLVLPMNIYKLANIRGEFTVKIECIQAIVLTLLQIPMDRNRHRALRCYDRDKQAWLFEAHMKSDRLKFYVFYGDIATIPLGSIRLVTIGVSVLPAYGNVKLVPAVNSPYTRHYTQRPQDDFGLEVPTTVTMKEIIDTKSIYIYENTNSLTIQIEWGDSYLLKESDFLVTDSIPRIHKMQMEREMRLLQKENLILEKQVHSYQAAIAVKDSKQDADSNQNQRAVSTNPLTSLNGVMQHPYGTPYDTPTHSLGANSNNIHGQNIHGTPLGTMTSGNPQVGLGNLSAEGVNGQYTRVYSPELAYTRGDIGVQGMGSQGLVGHGQINSTMSGPYGNRDLATNQYGPKDAEYPMRNDMRTVNGRLTGSPRILPSDVGVNGLPVAAERGGRARSADPNASYLEPRINRRGSTTGAEYADYLEQTSMRQTGQRYPEDRYKSNDGYRSDSGYRSDTMSHPNNTRGNIEQFGKDGRPRPTARARTSDSRSDFGDYNTERRGKASYGDRDVDAYSDRSYTESIPTSRSKERYALSSSKPRGRASYAGYEGETPVGLDYPVRNNTGGGAIDRYSSSSPKDTRGGRRLAQDGLE